jgi:hypothetical protein
MLECNNWIDFNIKSECTPMPEMQVHELRINDDGTIELDGEKYKVESIEDKVINLSSIPGNRKAAFFGDLNDDIIEALKKLPC